MERDLMFIVLPGTKVIHLRSYGDYQVHAKGQETLCGQVLGCGDIIHNTAKFLRHLEWLENASEGTKTHFEGKALRIRQSTAADLVRNHGYTFCEECQQVDLDKWLV